MATTYRHTQRGILVPAAMGAGGLVFLVLILLRLHAWPASAVPVALMSVAFVCFVGLGWYFSSMTIEVTDDELRWHFGPGGNFRIARADIASTELVRHPWWGGYGIRMRGMSRWIYIISGRDLVEVHLRQDGWRRLGTDDPQGLLAALILERDDFLRIVIPLYFIDGA
jgi:hypothetical protein